MVLVLFPLKICIHHLEEAWMYPVKNNCLAPLTFAT